jgi:putative ABC transport system permease protein
MKNLAQIRAVVAMNVLSLPSRWSLSLATVFAVTVVVAVLLSFLAMANGFQRTVAGSGADDVAVVLRDGAEAEINSVLTREQVNLLREAPGIASGPDGPLVSAELYVIVDGIKRSSGTRANLPLRGIEGAGLSLRPGVELLDGRMFRPGTNELIVGAGVLREFDGFELGQEMRFGRSTWRVVGVFSIPGTVFDSELWADARVVQSLFQRGSSFQTLRARLAGPEQFTAFADHVRNEPRLQLDVKRETDYFASQASGTTDLIMYLGWPLGIAMAFGALAGALNTMYTSVATREREIATLRAIGFSGTAAFVGTLVESLLLALIGGLLGAALAYLFFDGLSAATLGGSFTQVVFSFELSAGLLWQGALLALLIGLLGGVFPAWRAARVTVDAAFRARAG